MNEIDYLTPQRVRMVRREWWRKFVADLGAYYWGPCPICGMNTSGKEWGEAGFPSILTKDSSTRRGVCIACADEGRADSPDIIGTRDEEGNVEVLWYITSNLRG